MKLRELVESTKVQTISHQELASLIKRHALVTFACWSNDDYDSTLYALTDLPPHISQSDIRKLVTAGMSSYEIDILNDFDIFVTPINVATEITEQKNIDVIHTTWQEFYNAKIRPLLHEFDVSDDFKDAE